MEKYINRIKNLFKCDKKNENLLIALVLVIILLFSITYIFKDNKTVIEANSEYVVEDSETSIELKLEEILSKIAGISEVSVMINYSTTDKIIPVYDVKENIDKEQSEGRTSVNTVTEKNVAYQEGTNGKVPIVESTELAVAQGAIVVGRGVNERQ
ncbi:MAG: hypothetical protein IKV94_01285 [Clostridia bacterium]|nr:hypothetical protein [Clostridia bacterium]